MRDDGWHASRRRLARRFATLPPTPPEALVGRWDARFVGPRWVRALAGPAIAAAGMRGWCGKRIEADGSAVNLVRRGTGTVDDRPLAVRSGPSFVDGRTTALLIYPEGGLPWRHVVDELRRIDATTALGMTALDLPLVRRAVFPFLLERTAAPDVDAAPPSAAPRED
jgi:hypothetical protein